MTAPPVALTGMDRPPSVLTAGKDRRWEDTMLAKLLAGALLPWLCGAASSQQKWPSRNIEIIIPLSPDSGVDLIGRAVATA